MCQSQEPILREDIRVTMLAILIVETLVAMLCSVLVVVGLLIPLLIQLKNGTFRRSLVAQKRGSKEANYSTYNLYLVYLGLVDLAYLIPFMVAYWINIFQGSHPLFYSTLLRPGFSPSIEPGTPVLGEILIYPYFIANMWLNAIIAYQVLKLLEQSHRVQRICQPSLKRVNFQGGSIILASVVYGIVQYYYFYELDRQKRIGVMIGTAILFLIPIVYVIRVAILVRRRGYISRIGSAPLDKAVRGVALYFFRVVTVFFSIWLPAFVCAAIGYIFLIPAEVQFGEGCMSVFSQVFNYCTQHFLMNFQPILTFYMILTKPDVKKYIKDLVTLTYCRRRDDKEPRRITGLTIRRITGLTNMVDPEDPERLCGVNAASRRVSLNLLGFIFEDSDFDCNINVDFDDNVDVGTNRDGNVNCDTDTEQDIAIGISPVLDSGVCGVAAMIVEENIDNEDITSSVCKAEDPECKNANSTALSFIKGEHQLGRIMDVKYPEEEVVFDCNDDEEEEVLAEETEESIRCGSL